MAKRMGKGLIALSSAAIAAVYGIGYAATQPAAAVMAAGTAPDVASAAPSVAPTSSPAPSATRPGRRAASSPVDSPVASPSAGVNSAPSASPAASNGLKDGTYTGTGWSRHGSVTSTVTIKNGRIVSAPITSVTTRYSPNVISSLPGAVVSAQSAKVNMISGATDSSMAYESAVAQAIAQAGGTPPPASGVSVTGPNGSIYTNPSRGRRGYFDD